jgi:hypothetical protein
MATGKSKQAEPLEELWAVKDEETRAYRTLHNFFKHLRTVEAQHHDTGGRVVAVAKPRLGRASQARKSSTKPRNNLAS